MYRIIIAYICYEANIQTDPNPNLLVEDKANA